MSVRDRGAWMGPGDAGRSTKRSGTRRGRRTRRAPSPGSSNACSAGERSASPHSPYQRIASSVPIRRSSGTPPLPRPAPSSANTSPWRRLTRAFDPGLPFSPQPLLLPDPRVHAGPGEREPSHRPADDDREGGRGERPPRHAGRPIPTPALLLTALP